MKHKKAREAIKAKGYPNEYIIYVATPTTHHTKNNIKLHKKQLEKHTENHNKRQRTNKTESCY